MPAGVFALIDPAVALTMVAATPLIVTFALARLAPAIVIVVPPTSGPALGETLAIVGDAMYTNAPALVAVPPAVVTDTSRAPAAPIGVFPLIEFAEMTSAVAATPPTFTLVAPLRLLPLIVNAVPPLAGPVAGLTLAIAGSGTTEVNAAARVAVPPAVVTATSFTPAVLAAVTAFTEVAVATMRVADTPPTFTCVVPARSVPVMVMVVPPSVDPDTGVRLLITGAATTASPWKPPAPSWITELRDAVGSCATRELGSPHSMTEPSALRASEFE